MLIPENRQQDVIDIMWALTVAAESTVTKSDVLKQLDVEAAYRIFRDLGITKEVPVWLMDGFKWRE